LSGRLASSQARNSRRKASSSALKLKSIFALPHDRRQVSHRGGRSRKTAGRLPPLTGDATAWRFWNRTAGFEEEPRMRLLHTMLRVNNLDESLKFYCDALGMKLLRKHDFPNGEFTLAFVGYGDEHDNTVIELTHNWGQSE